MKKCTGCHENKALLEFSKDSKNADKKAQKCRACQKVQHDIWKAQTPDYAEKARAHRKRVYYANLEVEREKARLAAEDKRRKNGTRTREERIADDKVARALRAAQILAEKKCSECLQIKEVAEFCINKARVDGLSNFCRTCSAFRKTKWVFHNKEKVIMYEEEYRKKNKDSLKLKHKENYDVFREQILEKKRLDRILNPEVCRERARAYRAKYPDKAPESWRLRRARLAGAEGSHTEHQLRELLVQQANRCANPYCLREITERTGQRDHMHPISKGGSNDISNMQWLCASCNQEKKDMLPEEWYTRQGRRYA